VRQPAERGVALGAVEVKTEDVKEAGDSGNASDSPVPNAKRGCKEEEEGDWVPPKKIGRGPGTLDQ